MKIYTASTGMSLLVLGATAASVILYKALPPLLPIHWNIHGQPDGWGDKSWAAFALPATMAGLLLLAETLPRLRRSGPSLAPFLGTFRYVMTVTVGLMAFLHAMTLITALHPTWNLERTLISGILLALALIGNVLGKVRRNPYIGVRTPWTLSDDAVWMATHRLAAKLLFGVGLIGAAAVWLGVPPAVCFGGLIIAALIPAVYSWLIYERAESA
ncbi:MAG: SdpI family protein [Armatimonadota bacterium]